MNFYHTLLEQYAIMESLETVITANPGIERKTIEHYHKYALPDNNKNDRLLNHVLKLHKAGAITPDTAHLLKPHLTALSNTNQLNKLGSLNTFDDHINATKDIMDKSVTKKERIDKDTPVIANTPNLLVRQHLTQESAIKGARLHSENPVFKTTREHGKAQWCISVDDDNGKKMFDHYTEKGKHPVYTIFNKGSKRSTAMVPRPSDTYQENEIRGETDKLVSPYKLLKDNPGIEHVKPIMDHINQYMPEVHDVIKKVPFNANKKQIVDAITSSNVNYRDAATSHNITPYIDEMLTNNTAALHLLKIKYPLESHHIDQLVNDKDSNIRETMARHDSLEPHHIERLLADNNPAVQQMAATNRNITSTQIENIFKENDSNKLLGLTGNRSLTDEHINKLLNHNDPYVRCYIAQSGKLYENQLQHLADNDEDEDVRAVADEALYDERFRS